MVKYNIVQKHDKCIGCQSCVAVCPENWVMGGDGKANPKKKVISTKAEIDCNKRAETACPVQIIHLRKVK